MQDLPIGRMAIRRRTILTGLVLAVTGFSVAVTRASTVIGKANGVSGTVSRRQQEAEEALSAGDAILDKDYVVTGSESFADLQLGEDTRILLGGDTELLVDSFIAGQGGTLELGMGQMVFDRPEGLPKVDVAVRTAFGMIGVRGTKFFAGPSRGAFGVFVEHGQVSVDAGGVTRLVSGGEGVQMTNAGDPPSEPVKWSQERIDEAYASVGAR